MSNVSNLIIEAIEKKPYDMKGTFHRLIASKIEEALEAKKIEVAESFFGPEDEEVEDSFEEDLGGDETEQTDDTQSDDDEDQSDDESEDE